MKRSELGGKVWDRGWASTAAPQTQQLPLELSRCTPQDQWRGKGRTDLMSWLLFQLILDAACSTLNAHCLRNPKMSLLFPATEPVLSGRSLDYGWRIPQSQALLDLHPCISQEWERVRGRIGSSRQSSATRQAQGQLRLCAVLSPKKRTLDWLFFPPESLGPSVILKESWKQRCQTVRDESLANRGRTGD